MKGTIVPVTDPREPGKLRTGVEIRHETHPGAARRTRPPNGWLPVDRAGFIRPLQRGLLWGELSPE